jgi:hypothetical protein
MTWGGAGAVGVTLQNLNVLDGRIDLLVGFSTLVSAS